MRTGEELLSTLKEDTAKKYIENARKRRNDSYNNLLTDRYRCMFDFIDRGFIWAQTPEGHLYWYNIAFGLAK